MLKLEHKCLECLTSSSSQATLLGAIFFLVFSAYDTIQVYSKRLYSGNTGPNSTLCVYTAFTLCCLLAPSIIKRVGERGSIAIGVQGYATLVINSLYYFETECCDSLILVGGTILGCGAAILWTAQGSLILAYGANERDRGRVFSRFWACYRSAPLLGGFLTFGYFSVDDSQSAGSVPLFVTFLSLIVIGAMTTLLLKDPRAFINDEVACRQVASSLLPENERGTGLSEQGEFLATLQHFNTPCMMQLAILFVSSGSNEAYALTEFARFFSTRATGIGIVAFYSGSIVGTLCSGTMLDRISPTPSSSRSSDGDLVTHLRRSYLIVLIGSAIHLSAFASAIFAEFAWHGEHEDIPLNDVHILLPIVVYCLWGTSDGMLNTWLTWTIGAIYPEMKSFSEEAETNRRLKVRSVAIFKLLNSLGHIIGYALIGRSLGLIQLSMNIVLFIVGCMPLLKSYFTSA